MTTKKLPPAFAELEEYLAWALPTETQRLQKRETSTLPEIRAFYDAVLPHADAIMEHFRCVDRAAAAGTAVPAETRHLFTLMLAFSDASLSVELHRSPTVPDGMHWDLWKPEHETSGWQQKPSIRLFPAAA
ncbi:hypothetical protein H4CHR_04226 [Variovorax sp. PBS-H4]|uniref:hypothetical protein n=1 Tax=Variovorax sp. PBS-H4 TaxID=434008 RepID=UPI0013183BC6|nr:hypothetical protein [Variovorax sp. PBS-H4]VTU37656.1 hypothetical protein H4CHR_04226 [Variovorax sp. PBS-H4]